MKAVLAGALLSAYSTHAHAEDARTIEAEARFREASALAKTGKFSEALVKYIQSYALEPRASVLLGMALAEYELGQHVASIRHLREYLQSPKAQNVEELKAKVFAPLERQTGHVRVKLAPATQLLVDGVETAAIDQVVDVAASRHVFVAASDRREIASREIDIANGQTIDLDLSGEATPAPITSPPKEEQQSWWTTRHSLGVVTGGLALVATGIGVGFMAAREGHVSDGEAVLSSAPQPCRVQASATCIAYQDARSGISSAETAAIVSFIAAGALVTTAAVLILWPDRGGRTGARILPIGRALSLTGTF